MVLVDHLHRLANGAPRRFGGYHALARSGYWPATTPNPTTAYPPENECPGMLVVFSLLVARYTPLTPARQMRPYCFIIWLCWEADCCGSVGGKHEGMATLHAGRRDACPSG